MFFFLVRKVSSHPHPIPFVPHICSEAVQECERPGTCRCFSLCSFVWCGCQSIVILLQRSHRTADLRLSKGINTHTFLKHLNVFSFNVFSHDIYSHMFSIFFYSASDDRYGSPVSDKWISVPARAWRKWLHSSHRSHTSSLRKDLPSSQLHHDVLLQQYLQVRHKLRRVL